MGCSPSKNQVAAVPGRTMATYPLKPSFQYCNRLFVYTDDLKALGNLIPPPSFPTQTKAEIFDLEKFVDVDRKATLAPEDLLSQPYSKLMAFLMNGLKDTLSKVRVIYRWITAQPVDDMVINHEPDPTFPLHQLWRIQKGNGNYAQLFLTMCRLVGIPCVVINGLIKGSTYTIGQSLKGDNLYGEWNAVLIDGEWRFVNVFWGACAENDNDTHDQTDSGNGLKTKSVERKNNYAVYSCDENYFLTDPEHLSATHFPFVEQWQLRKNPITVKQFEEMALLKDRFFNLDMGLITHDNCVVRCLSGEVDFRFSLPIENSINLKFRHLLFQQNSTEAPSVGDDTKRRNQFVFLHKIQPDVLSLEIRLPLPGIYRLELVGKDATITKPGYDYDWVVLYKLNVEKGLALCKPFPKVSETGWGPGYETNALNIKPLSHKTGRVKAQTGEAQVRFDITDCQGMKFSHSLTDHENAVIKDHVVHWIEGNELVFLVKTPVKGEYALSLFAIHSNDNTTKGKNFCNYLVSSHQSGVRGAFPRDFGEGAGEKTGKKSLGVKLVSHSSPIIYCHREELEIVFELEKPIELFAAFSGVGLRAADSKRLIKQQTKGSFVYFKIRIPALGSFGLKVVGMDPSADKTFQNIYDYLIEFQKRKSKKKEEIIIHEHEEELQRKDSQLSIIAEMNDNEHLVEIGQPPEEMQQAVTEPIVKTETPEISFSDPRVNRARQKARLAVSDNDEAALESAIETMRDLSVEGIGSEITKAQLELDIMRTRREILLACKSSDPEELQNALANLKSRELEGSLRKEMLRAQRLVDRHNNILRNLHTAPELDSKTIAEIRSYPSPPIDVLTVMKATFLLLGHFEEDTQNWGFIVHQLSLVGKDAILKRMEEIDVCGIPVDIALGAKDYLGETTVDRVLLVSSGAAAIFKWTQDVIQTVISQFGKDVNKIPPRKKKSQTPFNETGS